MEETEKELCLLYSFLIAHGAFYAYCHNVWKQKGIVMWKKVINGNYAEYWIDYSFCWMDTPQGHEYWKHLDMLWRKHLRHDSKHLRHDSKLRCDYYKIFLD